MNLQTSQRRAFLCRVLTLLIFVAFSAATGAATINYGDFGPVSPGVRFNGVTESSGTDPVPLYGPPEAFSVGMDFDPTSFTAVGDDGNSDLTAGQLNFVVQGETSGGLVAIQTISLSEAGTYTLVGIGTIATQASAGAIIRVTVTQIDGVDVAPISLTPSNGSVTFNLLANVGINQPWSLGITVNIEAQLTGMGTSFTTGATRVEVVIDNELLAGSEASSAAAMDKQEFMVEATTVVSGSPTPTPTPTPSPAPQTQVVNLSTRMRVETGDNIGIGGFILTGSAPRHLLIRAIGPSLSHHGIDDPLQDPVLELHGTGGFVTIMNDNWRDTQEVQIHASGLPPSNDREAAIDVTLSPGAYTALVRGKDNTAGTALVEVYSLEESTDVRLANLSTRAFVSTGEDIVIAGFILDGTSSVGRMVVRGIGPSLNAFGLSPVLANPVLELRDGNGTLLAANDDWQDNPAQASEISAAGLAPSDPLEAAIAANLPPGAYTALLAGLNDGTGLGLVEIFDRGP